MSPEMIARQFNSKRKKLDDGMEVRHISPFLIDVFRGEGFKQHSRYRRTRSGEWQHVSGAVLTGTDLNRATA